MKSMSIKYDVMIQQKIKVGLLGVGLDTYWEQFEGLLPRLLTYQCEIAARIETMGVTVINTGRLDSPLKATECARQLKQSVWNWFFYLFPLMPFLLRCCLWHSR